MNWKTHVLASKPATELNGIHFEGSAYRETDFRSPPRQLAHIEASAESDGWEEVIPELADFWCTLAAAVERSMPSDRKWSYVLVDIDPSSGTIKSSLRDTQDHLRRIPFVVCIYLPFMQDQCDELPEQESLEDEVFNRGFEEILRHAHDQTIAAANIPAVRTLLNTLCNKHSISILLDWQGEDQKELIAGSPL